MFGIIKQIMKKFKLTLVALLAILTLSTSSVLYSVHGATVTAAILSGRPKTSSPGLSRPMSMATGVGTSVTLPVASTTMRAGGAGITAWIASLWSSNKLTSAKASTSTSVSAGLSTAVTGRHRSVERKF